MPKRAPLCLKILGEGGGSQIFHLSFKRFAITFVEAIPVAKSIIANFANIRATRVDSSRRGVVPGG